MEEKRAIKWIWRMPCSRSGRRVPGFTQVHICNIPPAYETFLGTLIMVVFLLARMFLKFNVHPSGVLGPSYRRFGSTCTMSIWTRDMEGDANQPPFTTLTRLLHKALALALAPLPRPLEWDTESTCTSNTFTSRIKKPVRVSSLSPTGPSRSSSSSHRIGIGRLVRGCVCSSRF